MRTGTWLVGADDSRRTWQHQVFKRLRADGGGVQEGHMTLLQQLLPVFAPKPVVAQQSHSATATLCKCVREWAACSRARRPRPRCACVWAGRSSISLRHTASLCVRYSASLGGHVIVSSLPVLSRCRLFSLCAFTLSSLVSLCFHVVVSSLSVLSRYRLFSLCAFTVSSLLSVL